MDAQIITTVRLMERKGPYRVELLGVVDVFRTGKNGVLVIDGTGEKITLPMWPWEPKK